MKRLLRIQSTAIAGLLSMNMHATRAEEGVADPLAEIQGKLDTQLAEARMAHEEAVSKLAAGYVKHLSTLKSAYQKSGKLDEVVKVAGEIGRFNEAKALAMDDLVAAPADLAKAQRDFLAAQIRHGRALNAKEIAAYESHIVSLDERVKSLTRAREIKRAQETYKVAAAAREKHASLKQQAEHLAKEAKVSSNPPKPSSPPNPPDRLSLLNRKKPPEDAVEWNGHHYKLFVDSKISYRSAKRACERLGGHLVTFDSRAEQKFVNTFDKRGTRWIGGSDAEEEGVFVWLDGSRVEFEEFNSVVDGENDKKRDYLYLKDGGQMGARTGDGNQKDQVYKWVNAYVCEWDY